MRDVVPWPGIKPRSPALGGQSLSHWTIREVPHCTFSSMDARKVSWMYSLVRWSGCDTGMFVCTAWSPATPPQPQPWFPNPSLPSFLLIWSTRENSGEAAGGTVGHEAVIRLGLSLRMCFLQETTHLSCIGIQNTVWVPAASDFVIAQNSNSICWFLCLHP